MASFPINYTDLVTQTIVLGIDSSSEFADYVPVAIGLAEDRMFMVVDIDLSKDATVVTINGNALVTKPADYRVGHNAYLIDTNGNRVGLTKKTQDYLLDYWPSTTLKAQPKYYADQDLANFRFAPTPDAVYTIALEYEFRPTRLSVSNQTNVWTDRYPSLLFYMTQSAMCEWARDETRKAEYEQKIMEMLQPIQVDTDRFSRDDATNQHNPDGGRNRKSVS